MAFEMDEDEVSWRDPATDGAAAPVFVRSESQSAAADDDCIRARAAAIP
jgi:hypothetical protein